MLNTWQLALRRCLSFCSDVAFDFVRNVMTAFMQMNYMVSENHTLRKGFPWPRPEATWNHHCWQFQVWDSQRWIWIAWHVMQLFDSMRQLLKTCPKRLVDSCCRLRGGGEVPSGRGTHFQGAQCLHKVFLKWWCFDFFLCAWQGVCTIKNTLHVEKALQVVSWEFDTLPRIALGPWCLQEHDELRNMQDAHLAQISSMNKAGYSWLGVRVQDFLRCERFVLTLLGHFHHFILFSFFDYAKLFVLIMLLHWIFCMLLQNSLYSAWGIQDLHHHSMLQKETQSRAEGEGHSSDSGGTVRSLKPAKHQWTCGRCKPSRTPASSTSSSR